jgi:phage tail protein X
VVEVGTETVAVVAYKDYARLCAVVTEAMPGMLEYQKLTTRRLPIIGLALA